MAASLTELAVPGIGSVTGRDSEPSVLAAAATGIVSFIERQRGDVDRIFGHAGISPEMAGSPTLQLNLHSYCRLFEESARLTRNDNFGLWFGNWEIIGPVVIIAVGVGILISRLAPRR